MPKTELEKGFQTWGKWEPNLNPLYEGFSEAIKVVPDY